jgi:hypothetical protein
MCSYVSNLVCAGLECVFMCFPMCSYVSNVKCQWPSVCRFGMCVGACVPMCSYVLLCVPMCLISNVSGLIQIDRWICMHVCIGYVCVFLMVFNGHSMIYLLWNTHITLYWLCMCVFNLRGTVMF